MGMASFFKISNSAVVLAGLLLFAPLLRAQDAASTAPKAASVEISPPGTQAQVGQKVKFSAVAKDASGKVIDEKPAVWFAAPFDQAGADQEGNVIFHSPGEVLVGAVVAGKAGFTRVTVVVPPPAKIEIAPIARSLPVGATTVLAATARLANNDPRSDVTIHWKSESPAIATIDDSGMITALAPGTAK